MRFLKRFKYYVTLLIIIILIVWGVIISKKLQKEKYEITLQDDISMVDTDDFEEIEEKLCMVDIKGAVNNPGVYQLDCTKNVFDVIKAAGDLTETADTSLVNLAKKITDEMVIIIYTQEEVANAKEGNEISSECNCPVIKNDACLTEKVNSDSGGDLININTASLEKIKELPGIGEAKAKAIIEYRDKNGYFQDITDILKVSGIGEKLYEEIKIYITT